MAGRLALWRLLVDRGLASGEAEARALCMAGDVVVDGRVGDKPGMAVPVAATVHLRRGRRFASRGGEKLDFALAHFGIAVEGRVALDAGASTGGFTDCLLQHGAARVYAVDAGYGQLLGRLRQDPRVVNMERVNLGSVPVAALQPRPTLVTLDLSYLPLAQAWRIVSPWLPAGSDVISLVKPLFEIEDAAARRSGVIEEPIAAYRTILAGLAAACAALGWQAVSLAPSPLRGSSGTVEFLLHAHSLPGAELPSAAIERAISTVPG